MVTSRIVGPEVTATWISIERPKPNWAKGRARHAYSGNSTSTGGEAKGSVVARLGKLDAPETGAPAWSVPVLSGYFYSYT